eukprot:g14740.t1 g14740   contig90:285909-287330(+)
MGESNNNGGGIAGLNLPMNFSSATPNNMSMGGIPIGSNNNGGGSRLPLSSGSSELSSSSSQGGGGMASLSSVLGGQQLQQQQQQAPIGGVGGNNNGSVGFSSFNNLHLGAPLGNNNNNNDMGGGTIVNMMPNSKNNPGSAVGPNSNNSSLTNNITPGSIDELHLLVLQLINPDQREGVLLELSKKRESFPDLAPILWHTYGTVAALLQEIVSIYPLLTPPTLTAHASNRVCNALALLQCVASHPDTRGLFLSAHVPLYLYPFLNTQSKSRPFEYLRLTSLGVIGALVKMDDADVINFLLQTEIIPLCLRIMEAGSELSKTVATFIVQKILLDEIGLSYVCATAERFYAVSTVLNNMIGCLVLSPSVRLLKHIVRCYLRLSDNARARDALRQALPSSLRDDTFVNALRDDVTVKKWLSQLLSVVGTPVEGGQQGGGGLQMPGGGARVGNMGMAMGGMGGGMGSLMVGGNDTEGQ